MPRRRSSLPEIGSPEWDRELASIGVHREVVDEELGVALGTSGAPEVDPHSLGFSGEPAEVAAAWVLFHQIHPSYGSLMYLRHVWVDADKVLRDWIEAIVCPEWQFRYYSFDAWWSPGEEMASMRNGSEGAYSIVFGPAGAFIRGVDHESPMSPACTGGLWPGLVDTVSPVFHAQVNEPAFSFGGHLDATFVLWRQHHDERWQTGVVDFRPYGDHRASPDGAELLATVCDPRPDSYLAFAADYYEVALDAAAVGHVWALRPLDDAVVAALNPDLTLVDVRQDAQEIGYARPQAEQGG